MATIVKSNKGGRRRTLTPGERQALDLVGQAVNAELIADLIKEENGNSKSLSPPPIDIEGVRRILIAAIRVSKDNPRECPTPESLAGLVESIRAHGVLEPIIVRPTSEHDERLFLFEIVAGERRYRAAGLAGLQEIPALVRVLDDRQAREVGAVENLQREDLTPIEEARCYRSLLEGEGAPTQEELGKRVGVSQPQISARLALLKLPEKWQKRIGSGEIPPTHARFVMPFRERPQILKSIEERIAMGMGVGSLAEFGNDVHEAARSHTRRIGGDGFYEWKIYKDVPRFTPTPEQRKALDIIEILDDGEGDDTVEVACNVKLWNKLQAEFADRFIKEELAKRTKKGEGGQGDKGTRGKGDKPKPSTAAELKAQAEADRRRAKEAAERTANGMAEWRVDWLGKLIADRLGKGSDANEREQLLLYFAASDRFPAGVYARQNQSIRGERHKSLAKILRVVGGVGDLWPAIENEGDMDNVLSWLRGRFWDAEEKGPAREVPAQDVERIAVFLGVDPAAAWKGDQKADAGEGFWNLHTKEQLLDLGKELGVHFDAQLTKAVMIKRLMTAAKPLAMPRELAGKPAGKRRKSR